MFYLLRLSFHVIITGCLKDKDFDNGGRQSTHGSDAKAIEIKLTATNASNFFTLAVNNSTNDTTVDLVPINLATANAASEDLHVTVDLDSALVNVYNTDNGTAYAIPHSSFYTIVNPDCNNSERFSYRLFANKI